jgi:hypothetical protein
MLLWSLTGPARRMTELLSDKPGCEAFKERMREAGKGSPYEGRRSESWSMRNRTPAPQAAASKMALGGGRSLSRALGQFWTSPLVTCVT